MRAGASGGLTGPIPCSVAALECAQELTRGVRGVLRGGRSAVSEDAAQHRDAACATRCEARGGARVDPTQHVDAQTRVRALRAQQALLPQVRPRV